MLRLCFWRSLSRIFHFFKWFLPAFSFNIASQFPCFSSLRAERVFFVPLFYLPSLSHRWCRRSRAAPPNCLPRRAARSASWAATSAARSRSWVRPAGWCSSGGSNRGPRDTTPPSPSSWTRRTTAQSWGSNRPMYPPGKSRRRSPTTAGSHE